MFHLAAYTASLAAVTNSDVPAITDGWLSVQNNHFIAQQDLKLLFAWCSGSNISTNARLNTPHYRGVNIINIQPIDTDSLPLLIGHCCVYEPPYLRIPRIDEIAFEASTSAAGPTRTFGVIGIGDGVKNIPQGDIYTCRFTATITGIVNGWARGAIVPDQGLPAGRYSVVGMLTYGATLIASRLRFQEYSMLPGCPGCDDATRLQDFRWRMGRMGEYGQFENTALPSIEILCRAADTAQTVFLDLIKIR